MNIEATYMFLKAISSFTSQGYLACERLSQNERRILEIMKSQTQLFIHTPGLPGVCALPPKSEVPIIPPSPCPPQDDEVGAVVLMVRKSSSLCGKYSGLLAIFKKKGQEEFQGFL